jgi:uncharacterized protein
MADRDESGLLQATRVLYERGREAADPLLPPDAELNVFEAAAFGRARRLGELLAADPDAARSFSPDGFTPLHLACFSGGADAVRVLVDHGAPLETVSRASIAQVRPLATAAFSGDAAAARVLLEAGADPNGAGGGGGTPLQTARENGNEELAALLEEFGATH